MLGSRNPCFEVANNPGLFNGWLGVDYWKVVMQELELIFLAGGLEVLEFSSLLRAADFLTYRVRGCLDFNARSRARTPHVTPTAGTTVRHPA